MRILLMVVGIVLLWSAPASAQRSMGAPQTQVERGLSEFQELEFAKAIATLEPVTLAAEATPSQRLLALELIAISHLSLGDGPGAEVAFERLLHLRPNYQLRHHDGSPKVSTVFEKVRRRVVVAAEPTQPKERRNPKLVLSWKGLDSSRAGKRVTITLHAAGPRPMEIRLWWKPAWASRYRALPMRLYKESRWRARVSPQARRQSYEILFYAEALGPAGEVIASVASSKDPAKHKVLGRSSSNRAWYRSWKVWAGAATVAVLGGTAAILSTRSDGQEGSLAPRRITLSP